MSNTFANISVVVLAGGRGTRVQAFHPDVPKPMIPVSGKPFLHWLTLWLASHGPRHFVYSTGYRSEQVETWCQSNNFPDLVRICSREDEPLGTGGGLLHCLGFCREWILVSNGDGLVMGGIKDLLDLRYKAGVDGGLVGVEMEDAVRYGSLCMDDANRLLAFREKVPGRGVINGGLYLFRTDILRALHHIGPCSIEYDLFPSLIERGANLHVVSAGSAPFIDIGAPETLIQASSFVRQHLLRH